MSLRIVVGNRYMRKLILYLHEFEEVRGKKQRASRSLTIYDEDHKINKDELFKVIVNAVSKYAKTKGEVKNY